MKNVEKWVQDFCNFVGRGTKFRVSDAFVGFQKDTAASVVFHASKLFQLASTAVSTGASVEGDKWHRILQWCKVEHNSVDTKEEQDAKINAVRFEVDIN